MGRKSDNPGENTNAPTGNEQNATTDGINEAVSAQNEATRQATTEGAKIAADLEQTPQQRQPTENLTQQAPGGLPGLQSGGIQTQDAVNHLQGLGYQVTPPAPQQSPKSLEEKFGEGYVTATRDVETTYFSKQGWKDLQGDKGGWKKQTKSLPELEELDAKKNAE